MWIENCYIQLSKEFLSPNKCNNDNNLRSKLENAIFHLLVKLTIINNFLLIGGFMKLSL